MKALPFKSKFVYKFILRYDMNIYRCLVDVSYRLLAAADLSCIWNDFKQDSALGIDLTGRKKS